VHAHTGRDSRRRTGWNAARAPLALGGCNPYCNSTSAAPAKTRIQKLFAEKVIRKHPDIFPSGEGQRINFRANAIAYVVGQSQSYSLLASSFREAAAYSNVVVNCTELKARELCEDETVYPSLNAFGYPVSPRAY